MSTSINNFSSANKQLEKKLENSTTNLENDQAKNRGLFKNNNGGMTVIMDKNTYNIPKTVSGKNQLTDEMTVISLENSRIFKNDDNMLLTIKENTNKSNCAVDADESNWIATALASDTSLNHRQKRRILRRVNKIISKSEFT